MSRLTTIAESPPPYSSQDDRSAIPEHLLARLWQRRAARQQWFRTDRGLRVRVLYPGRPGKSAGPDFRNALLEFEGVGLVQGDVEIHRRQQDWDAHGHHQDPNYNGVVLHAALETDSSATRVPSGQPVSVVSLSPLLEEEQSGKASPEFETWKLLSRLGYSQPTSTEEMGALLDRAGDARFQAKSARFQKFLEEQDSSQTMYEALFEGLGYQHNQGPFLTLAARTPYQALERAATGLPPAERVATLESWLLKQAGLLPEGAAPNPVLPRACLGQPMSGREWRCFRVRPANHPRQRIAGAARLLARFLDAGLVQGLQWSAASGRTRDLTDALAVAGDSNAGPAYIGAARARDLAVNVVLPFLHGVSASQGTLAEAQRYLELYHQFGKLQENELTREMSDLLMGPSGRAVVTTARRQQGLVHLQRLLAGATS